MKTNVKQSLKTIISPMIHLKKLDEQSDVSETKADGSDKRQDQGKELEEYSEGVKKRIAKLTRKMREAERQRDEALSFAERTKKRKRSAYF